MRIFPELRFLKKFLPRSLLWRSLLIIVVPIFLVQVITTYMFFDRHWQRMGDRLAFALAGEMNLMADAIEAAGHEAPEDLREQVRHWLDLTLIYLPGEQLGDRYHRDRDILRDPSRENIIAQTLARAVEQQTERPIDIVVDRDEKWVDVRMQLAEGVMVVSLPERRIFSSSGYIVLLWMSGSSLVLMSIAILFMRNQIRPIRRLAIAAERFGKGRDVPFFKVEGAREVRQAARAFIQMRDRLHRQIQQRTAMLAGVSHDLRTPLTRMKLQVEMMDDTPDARDLKSDLADMERMIDAYLQFARGQGQEDPVRTDLIEMIRRVASNANREQPRVSVNIEKGSDDRGALSLLLQPVAFERCLNNLVTNALKFGTQAWITVRRDEDVIEIDVDDNGPGVPPEQYDDVFKPFYRGEASRNLKTGGVGLGLPIAQDIVLSHGGQIGLMQSPQGGLRVFIELPV